MSLLENIVEYGDCRAILRQWADSGVRVQSCVTSPPYWGLRDYGVDGQLGMERTPEEYVQTLVWMLQWVKILLADDGVLWLNLGDSYAGSWGNYSGGNRGKGGGQRTITNGSRVPQKSYEGLENWRPPASQRLSGIKQKDLVGIPWMVAFALRADGWYLRQDIIWSKPNPMPESVRDRCTRAHEYIFMLTKSAKYYYDGDAVATPCKESTRERLSQATLAEQQGSTRVPGKTNGNMRACFGGRNKSTGYGNRKHSGNEDMGNYLDRGANKRSVWEVTTKPFKGAHFATFPPDLIAPCILAGSRTNDIILDPFIGSGTTAQVALSLGRRFLGCELNPAYAELIDARIAKVSSVPVSV